MHTFMIEPECRKHLPEDILRCIRERLDIVPQLDRSALKGCGPVADTELVFSPGLNVISGPGGSGKTFMLESIKSQFDSPVKTTKPPKLKADIERLSDGQRLLAGLHSLVEMMPPASCLLADELLSSLDDRSIREALATLDRAPQIVMTISSGHLPRFLKHAGGSAFTLFTLFQQVGSENIWAVRQGRWGSRL